MFKGSKFTYKKYYGWLYHLFSMQKRTQLIAIDFGKPWWSLVLKQKGAFFINFFIEGLNNIFLTIPALLLERILNGGHFDYFLYFVVLWLIILGLEVISDFYATRTHVQCVQSIHYSAMQKLLKIDPIFHATNIKGKIIAKIYRGADAYKEMLRISTYELLSVFVGAVTVVISLMSIDLWLGFLSFALLFVFSSLFSFLFLISARALMPICIDADDRVKNAGLESINQISLIRSTFTSCEIHAKLKVINKKRLGVEGTSWRCYDILSTLTKVSYVLVFAVIGFYIIALMKTGKIAHMTGIALLITFFNGTYQLLQIGQFIYRFKEQLERVKDVFSYMGQCGRQTFPVLEQKSALKPIDPACYEPSLITIEARNVKFKYNARVSLFSNQTLSLSIPSNQPHKLYGIIGYSGQGKSTLLSILGGQLRPQEGTVLINGRNIYEINDEERRKLIAIQHQSSSSLHGTVKYNLTFGLPSKPVIYPNEILIDVLKRVGLWEDFMSKRGLDTFLSEGALTLSSGQRQRLNFAGLYLRSFFYHPKLILIDEPTSSLDEVSEKSIFEMIDELAQQSVVFVVTHKIKTIDHAIGILDFSIMHKEKELSFLDATDLMIKSCYYQQLLYSTISPVAPRAEKILSVDVTQDG